MILPAERQNERGVALDLIDLPADNPRREIGDVSELAASIAAVGMLEPLVLTPRGDRYLLVCGARRYTAAAQLKLAEAPVVVRELTEQERREAMLIENLQREDLQVLEESAAYKALVDLGLTQRELSARIGRSQGHISKRLALLDLPPAVRRQLDSGGIKLEDAQELLKLRAMPKRLQAAWKQSNNGYGSVSHSIPIAVREQLVEHERAERRGTELERLKKAGVRILEPARGQHRQLALPKGTVEISKQGGYDALKLDPRTHAKEPCHAAVIWDDDYNGVRVRYLCTDRRRHPKLKTEDERWTVRNSGARTKERTKERAHRDAARGRREFEKTMVAGRVAKDEALQRLVDGFLDVSQQEPLKLACELLGLEPKIDKQRYGTYRDFTSPLRAFAAGSAAQLQRAALALGLAAVETHMTSTWVEWGVRERHHLEYLEVHGYQPTDAERTRAKLKRKDGR